MMSTDHSLVAENLRPLCRQVMQKLVERYGWQPDWETPAEIAALLAAAQNRAGTIEPALERAALHRYCVLWYAACRSENPFQQRAAFTALHAYLFGLTRYLVMTRYNVLRAAAEQFAADSAQLALANIWQALGQMKDDGAFIRWVRTFAGRAVTKTMKGEPVMASLDAEDEPDLEDATTSSTGVAEEPEEPAEEAVQEVEAVMRRCLRSKNQLRVIIETFLNNRTVKQVADLLNKTPGNVSKLKHDALNTLRKCGDMNDWMEKKRSGANKDQPTPENIQHLLRAVAGERDTQLTCAMVEQWLPSYVDDEVAGEDVAAKYPDMKRHLDFCPDCEPLYVEMLELALAEAADLIPKPAATPKPDLSFLPLITASAVARYLVNAVAQKTLAALAPRTLTGLADFSDLFFQRVEALGGRLPAYRGAPATLGLEKDPAGAALLTLTVAYLTAQRVAETLDPQALQSQISPKRLSAVLLPLAEQVARENGMNQTQAQTFARIYTEQVQQDADAWLFLVASLR